MDLITKAILFAQEKHKGMLDDKGLDYFETHLCQVVRILENVTNDSEILAAGYLHDTIEDTETTYEELVDNFGPRVANLVMEVTQEGEKDWYGRWFPRLKSKDAYLIKFADRLSNLSRMQGWSEERQQHYLNKSRFWKVHGPGKYRWIQDFRDRFGFLEKVVERMGFNTVYWQEEIIEYIQKLQDIRTNRK